MCDDNDLYTILLCVYNSTQNPMYDSKYGYVFTGHSKYLKDRFDFLCNFQFLCKTGLAVFNENKSRLLSTTRKKTYTNNQGKTVYKFSYYPNGYISEMEQHNKYDYRNCSIVKLGTKGLFYIPDMIRNISCISIQAGCLFLFWVFSSSCLMRSC